MRRAALVALVVCGAIASPAAAHEGNPNFESLVTAVDGQPGLTAEILNGDDRLLLVNETGRTVVVEGYDGEPYARLRADGTVEVNRRSPARYLNSDRFGQTDVPDFADPQAEPVWAEVGRGGRYEFHDHRIHWMTQADPPQVKDKSERTRVQDWVVPLDTGAVRGTLWWRGDGGGAPVAMFAGLAAFALLAAGFVVLVRRRRSRAGAGSEAW